MNVDPGSHAPGPPPGRPRPPERDGFDRATALARLAAEEFDVLVIGGGITGAGVALDAASRGLRTALVEKDDFSSGTSSRSSKLVHGGLRYLRQREIRLVYESLAERQRLLHNAPHLVTPLPFLIPLFGRDGAVAKAVARSYSVALWTYDLTGGWRIGAHHRRVDRGEALAHLPALRTDRLAAGLVYFDAWADDSRLALAVLRTAVLDHGAVAANYACAAELRRDAAGRVTGARVTSTARPGTAGSSGRAAGGPDLDVRAHVVVNASGVWADAVQALEEGDHRRSLRPAKGVHVTVPAALLPCDWAAVLPVQGDQRSVFVVPWPESATTYIGTTDTEYDGPLDNPTCQPEDVDYLLDAVNAATTAGLGRADVTGVWAGLRPLLDPGPGTAVPARTTDLSRRHSVRTSADGMVTVTGGKLTTYRRMAQDAVDAAVAALASGGARGAPGHRSSATARLRLRGAPGRPPARRAVAPGPGRPAPSTAERSLAEHLRGRYGTEAPTVLAVANGRPELLQPVVAGLPYVGAEVVYAARAEMAQSVQDVLCRRTRAALQDARASAAAADPVARLLAPELGWTAEHASAHAEQFAATVRAELDAAGLTAGLGERR